MSQSALSGLAHRSPSQKNPQESKQEVQARYSSGRCFGESSSEPTLSPGIACFSDAHAPRSMSLQRSVQNGRQGDDSDHSTGRLQVGQGTSMGSGIADGGQKEVQLAR